MLVFPDFFAEMLYLKSIARFFLVGFHLTGGVQLLNQL